MADPREREWNERGEYEELYSPEEVYGLVMDAPHHVVTTADIADAMGCTRATARRKLQDLQLDRKIDRRDTPGRVVLWFPPEESDETDETDSDSEDAEMRLKHLSTELGEAIRVGDTVYESGDKHPVEQAKTS